MTPTPKQAAAAAKAAEVLKLAYGEHLGIRPIARRLKMSRKTVSRILAGDRAFKETKTHQPRETLLAPYDTALRQLLDDVPEITAPAALEKLRPLGYRGGVTILRARLRLLRPQPRQRAFLTLHFQPGAAAMVDWADFGFALPGCPRRVSAFVMVLCYSRLIYLEFTLSQAMGSFLRCMERALRFFGGATLLDIFDNMKTVVLSHTAAATVFNPRFLEYARVRGLGAVACNPGEAHEKGGVERPIGYLRRRFWPGVRPAGLLDLNTKAAAWRDTFANNREHEVTGKVPALVFAHEEKAVLAPVRDVPFNTDDVDSAVVSKTFRVRFDRNLYSVPPQLVGQTVLVRATDETVLVFLETKQVACHRRSWSINDDVEDPAHRALAAAHKPRARAAGELPPGLAGLGETGARYFKVLAAGSRSINREITRLVLLVELYGETATREAADEVMRTGHVGAEYVEYVLRHKRGMRPAPPPLRLGVPDLDAIAFREPDLGLYDQLARPKMTLDPGEPSPAAADPSDDGGNKP
jgi:transposase